MEKSLHLNIPICLSARIINQPETPTDALGLVFRTSATLLMVPHFVCTRSDSNGYISISIAPTELKLDSPLLFVARANASFPKLFLILSVLSDHPIHTRRPWPSIMHKRSPRTSACFRFHRSGRRSGRRTTRCSIG
jgi:hypothetical protein